MIILSLALCDNILYYVMIKSSSLHAVIIQPLVANKVHLFTLLPFIWHRSTATNELQKYVTYAVLLLRATAAAWPDRLYLLAAWLP